MAAARYFVNIDKLNDGWNVFGVMRYDPCTDDAERRYYVLMSWVRKSDGFTMYDQFDFSCVKDINCCMFNQFNMDRVNKREYDRLRVSEYFAYLPEDE